MKKMKYLLMSSLILGATLIAPMNSLADDRGANYSSNGLIEFTPNEDPTDPVDPTDPEKPVKPVDPTDPDGPNPGTNGPLSIDFASSFYFGKQKITSKNEDYKASAQEYKELDEDGNETGIISKGPNYVQVTDNRGTEAGWTLTVKQEGQFISDMKRAELTGAKITLSNGNVVTNSDSTKPTGKKTITLDPDGAESMVMAADVDQGAGTYLLDWGSDETSGATSVNLNVPGSTTKYADSYSTRIVWTLTDVPGNGAGNTQP